MGTPMRALLCWALLAGTPALALPGDGDLPDASAPDASVGEGGADRDNPEADDGKSNGPCRSTKDCEFGFTCVSARCVYTGVRTAGGCAGGPAAMVLSLGVLGVVLRRRAGTRRR